LIFLLDNYDSFTFNLVDYLQQAGAEVIVKRNDEIDVEEIIALNPAGIVLSPGPETPDKAGIMMELIHQCHASFPILGICLGLQAIGEYFGAKLVKAPVPMHGKTSICQHKGHWLFEEVPENFEVMRYHSLVIEDLPENLEVTSRTIDEAAIVMSIVHQQLPIEAVQFHPESILTPNGIRIIKNWYKKVSHSQVETKVDSLKSL